MTTTKQALQNFQRLMTKVRRQQLAKKRRAGKHQCVWVKSGSMDRVTGGRDGSHILKRPVKVGQFYECTLCGETDLRRR